jgi:hypothetical protein
MIKRILKFIQEWLDHTNEFAEPIAVLAERVEALEVMRDRELLEKCWSLEVRSDRP